MRDGGGSGAGGDVSVDETALASFVDLTDQLAGELGLRLAEAADLDRRVRNASPDAGVPAGALDSVAALVVRWQGSALSVDGIRRGVTGADASCAVAGPTAAGGSPGVWAWGGSGPGARGLGDPMSIEDEDDAGRLVEIFPVAPDLGLGIEILPPSPDLGLGIEILPPSPDLGLGTETLPPSPDLGTGIEIFPLDDDQRVLREYANRKRRAGAKSAMEPPAPIGPVFHPDDPYTPVPVNGRLYPAHQVTFWPTGRTAPGPDGKPQPLYDTKLLGQGASHIDNNTLINTNNKRVWHLDVENPDPGGRPGQFHLQYQIKGQTFRHMYDFNTDQFLPTRDGIAVPGWLNKEVGRDGDFRAALNKARDALNVPDESRGR